MFIANGLMIIATSFNLSFFSQKRLMPLLAPNIVIVNNFFSKNIEYKRFIFDFRCG